MEWKFEHSIKGVRLERTGYKTGAWIRTGYFNVCDSCNHKLFIGEEDFNLFIGMRCHYCGYHMEVGD